MEIENNKNLIVVMVSNYKLKLVEAIDFWVIGPVIIKSMTKAFYNIVDKSNTDQSLKAFLKVWLGFY
jgi:hypothetical protein